MVILKFFSDQVDVGWKMIAKTIGFKGDLVFNTSKPDGTPRKLMDVSRLHGLGWKHTIQLEEGIRAVYDEMKNTEVFNHSA
mgnify:CR=1 FL=1